MTYLTPLSTALFCLGLMTARRFAKSGALCREKRELLNVAMLFYAAMAVNWAQPLLYLYLPEVYAHQSAVFFVGLMLTQVLFYHIVYKITAEEGKPFPRIHYAVIGVLGALFAEWSLLVPYDVRLALTVTGEPQAGYEFYSMLAIHKLEARGVYSLVYGFLCIRRLLRYRKTVVEYSADRSRSALEWLYVLIVLTLALASLPLAAFFFSNQALAASLVPVSWSAAYTALLVVLFYNLLAGNYEIILPEKPKAPKENYHRYLNKTDFETYIRTKKPYLKPKLKITDLSMELGTNRAYLSGFINKEYGMNFSRYINLERLKELEQLRANPEYKDLSEEKRVLKAGFSTYHGYSSFMRAEKRILKPRQ